MFEEAIQNPASTSTHKDF